MFIAPSIPFQGDQAVDAHAARAQAHSIFNNSTIARSRVELLTATVHGL